MSIVEPLLFPEPEVLSPEDELLVSVVIPCLNEAANIERCVTWARTTLAEHGIRGEVVVADNDSEDESAPRSRSPPARASSASAAAATATPTWPASPPPRAATSSWPTPT